MNLSLSNWRLLNNYVGEGPIHKAKIVFFGNEFGLAQNNIENYLSFVNYFVEKDSYIPLGKDLDEGFMILGEKPLKNNFSRSPLNSSFVRFCAQFMLAYNHNNDRFLDKLTTKGISFVNEYIMDELHKVNSVIINLRPLPRPSEEQWIYENVNKNTYSRSYRFSSKHIVFDKNVKPRIANIFRAFYKAPSPLIIGTGDKWNKKNLFERVLSETNFEEIILNDKKIIIDKKQKIVFCDYFDNRVLGLSTLKELFNYLKRENVI